MNETGPTSHRIAEHGPALRNSCNYANQDGVTCYDTSNPTSREWHPKWRAAQVSRYGGVPFGRWSECDPAWKRKRPPCAELAMLPDALPQLPDALPQLMDAL